MAESGFPGFDLPTWYAIAVPAGTPEPIQARLQAETARALADPALRARLEELGLAPVGSDLAAARALIPAEIQRAREIVARAGIPQQ